MKRFGVVYGRYHWFVYDYKHGGHVVSRWPNREIAENRAGILNRISEKEEDFLNWGRVAQ